MQSIYLFVLACSVTAVAAHAGDYAWQSSEGAVALQRGAEPVWVFHYRKDEPKPYFDPVALPGLGSLTWNAPPDHPWHHGMWFSWKLINGLNYWEEDSETGQSQGVNAWGDVCVTTNADASATITLSLSYHPPGKDPVLTEQRRIEIAAPGDDGRLVFDWYMTFTAVSDVELDRTPVPGEPGGQGYGGYAGLSVRLARDLKDYRVVSIDDRVDMKAHGAKHAALDFGGTLDGKPVGVAILDHPDNLNAPSPWYLVMLPGVPFAYFSPAVVFHGPYRMKAGESLELKYRVIVHPGEWGPGQFTEACRRFTGAGE